MAKNTKQSKQKKSVLNKLGGLSKRSKFIVVVLIFAVLGGGYLTYKSFAATAGPAPIVTTNANFYLWNDTGCTSNKVNDASKNNALVMNIYCPPGKFFAIWNPALNYNTTFAIWPQGTYKNCATVKGVGKFGISRQLNKNGNPATGAIYFDINDPNFK